MLPRVCPSMTGLWLKTGLEDHEQGRNWGCTHSGFVRMGVQQLEDQERP